MVALSTAALLTVVVSGDGEAVGKYAKGFVPLAKGCVLYANGFVLALCSKKAPGNVSTKSRSTMVTVVALLMLRDDDDDDDGEVAGRFADGVDRFALSIIFRRIRRVPRAVTPISFRSFSFKRKNDETSISSLMKFWMTCGERLILENPFFFARSSSQGSDMMDRRESAWMFE